MFMNEESKIPKGSKVYLYTNYLNYIVVFLIGCLALFFSTYLPETGFAYLFVFFCYLLSMIGVHYYDNISRILLILLNLVIGAYILTLLGTFNFLIIYFIVPILTIYTMIFDKRTYHLFKSSFKGNLWKLNFVLLLQYVYLMYFGFSNIPAVFNGDSTLFFLFYGFVSWIFINLLAVHLLKFNAKILMFITAPAFIIYSYLTLQTNNLGVIAIIINILTLLVLLFDKQSTKMFTKVDSGSYYFYKTTIFLNVISFISSIFAILYMYSYTLDPRYLYVGIIFIPFYGFTVYKVKNYSFIWKNVLSLLMIILLVASLALNQYYMMMTLMFIPTSLVTIYALNVDFSTANLFRKNAPEYEQHNSLLKKVHFHLN